MGFTRSQVRRDAKKSTSAVSIVTKQDSASGAVTTQAWEAVINTEEQCGFPLAPIKPCSVVLPLLSTPISTTISLLQTPTPPPKKLFEIMEEDDHEVPMARNKPLRRPIYLGDMVIGYETISQKKTQRSQGDGVSKRKKANMSKTRDESLDDDVPVVGSPSNDLTPTVIPQSNVRVVGNEGRKRRVNLSKVRNSETMNEENTLSPEDEKEVPLILDLEEEESNDNWAYSQGNFATGDKENEYSGREDPSAIFGEIPRSKNNSFFGEMLIDDNDNATATVFDENTAFNCFDDDDSGHHETTSLSLSPPPYLTEEGGNENEENCPLLPICSKDQLLCEKEPDSLQLPSKDFCNICGAGVQCRKNEDTFLEINKVSNTSKAYICLTCNQKFSIIELSRHKATCFLSSDEFYYPGCEWADTTNNRGVQKEIKFRMVACKSCVESMKAL